MSNPLLAALVQAAVSGPTSGTGKGTGREVYFSFRNFGMCQHSDNYRHEHVDNQWRDSGYTLTGPDASKKSASQSLQVHPNLHDFFGFSKGAAPYDDGEQYGKITVVDREQIISQLVAVEDGQLTHRIIPVPATVHSEVHTLLEFFGTGVSIGGRLATTQDMQQQLKAFTDHLRSSGWRPRASTGDIIAGLGNMSAENRAAVLGASGDGDPIAPGPSPPRKAGLFGAGPGDAMNLVPPLPYVDISAPRFPDTDMAEAPGNADLARVENDLLAQKRSSRAVLPSVQDKAAWEENAPLNVAALDGMVLANLMLMLGLSLNWPRW
eukprot:s6044_g3.t1